MHETLFAGIQAQRHIALIAADDLRIGAGGARQRTALADLHLDIVHDRADRHVRHRHRVAGLHIDLVAGDDFIAHRHSLRRQDIGELAVGITDQRDEGRAVRIIFEPLDLPSNAGLTPLEVDDAISLLVAAAAEAHRDAAVIVAAAGRALALGQALDGLAFIKVAPVDDDELAKARRDGLEGLECHCLSLPASHRPVVTSMRLPSARVTIAFLKSDCWPRRPRNVLRLPLRNSVFTASTLTSNSPSTAALISGFVASLRTLKITLFSSDALVAFSVITGETITS